jgi:hypothetical protein
MLCRKKAQYAECRTRLGQRDTNPIGARHVKKRANLPSLCIVHEVFEVLDEISYDGSTRCLAPTSLESCCVIEGFKIKLTLQQKNSMY